MRKPSTFALALVWAVFVVVAVHFLDFPGSVPNFRQVSGGGTLFDAVPAFTADDLYERLDAYGDAGRQNYFFRNVTIDILLPLSVLPVLLLLMARAARVVAVGPVMRAALLLVPVVYVILDLLENAIVLVLLDRYPERLDALAMSVPYVTIPKRVASLLAVGVPVLMLGLGSLRRSRTPKARDAGKDG